MSGGAVIALLLASFLVVIVFLPVRTKKWLTAKGYYPLYTTKAYAREFKTKRKASYPVAGFIIDRWSPRAMSGEPITDQQLMTLFEAARWAPSSYNNQWWRFIYAKRDTPEWDVLFDLLVDFNKQWAKNAAALVVIVSKTTFDFNGKPARTHSFDTGAAWENIALQGTLDRLVVHGIEGFDYDRAREVLAIPDDYKLEAMFAVGHQGSLDTLPADIAKKEQVSDRKPLSELVFRGTFGNPALKE